MEEASATERATELRSIYAELGIDPSVPDDEQRVSLERLSRQATALAITSPERSQRLRDAIRKVRQDLQSHEELVGGADAAPPAPELCGACGAAVRPTTDFCTTCGRARRALTTSTCLGCGGALDHEDAFCSMCGRSTTPP